MKVYRPINKNEYKFQMYLVPGMIIDFLLKITSVIPGTKNGVFRYRDF